VTLWRMERLRLFRTGRWIPVAIAYVLFGVVGPLSVRYLRQIIDRFGSGDLQIVVPTPTPPDGIHAFMGNAQQIGLLATVIIAAGALAFDARPTVSAFLRTRVRTVDAIVLPRYATNAALTMAAFTVAAAVAWVLTDVLIGSLATVAMIEGILLALLYLAFAVAVVALAAGLGRSQLSTVLVALGFLIALPILGLVKGVGRWLPSTLIGAIDGLLAGVPFTHYIPAIVVTVVAVPALVWGAGRLLASREL
jgi:ABC-2 type transport system permease protein